jgi:hypothetical protein
MKKFYLIICVVFIAITASSQVESDFERFKREQEEGLQKEREKFQQYKEARDKEFADYLKQEWENFQLFKAGEPISLPGPEEIPVIPEDVIPEVPLVEIPAINIKPIKQPIPIDISIKPKPLPIIEKPLPIRDIHKTELSFYGTQIKIDFPKSMLNISVKAVTETEIAKFWEDVSNSDYEHLIELLWDIRNDLALNDFAYYKLVENLTEKISKSKNQAKLMTWFILNKSGYNVRAGYNGNDIHLLIPVSNQLYGLSFYTFDNTKYYLFDKDVRSIKTYQGNYPEANRIMDFNVYTTPLFAEKKQTRELEFFYEGKQHRIFIDYNKNHIDFYNDYPQGDIKIFFDAGMSPTAQSSLIANFDSLLFSMSETEATSFLLRFTQTAFEYATDEEQFGVERYFFAEELLHYPFSDCEDRSVFFAYMIQEFLQLPVIGLHYPGHIATAVNFSEDINGVFFMHDNKKFVVCDPTYVNAPIGLAMPEFNNAKVTLIALENTGADIHEYAEIWAELHKNGIYRFNNTSDIFKQTENLYFLCGFLADTVKIGGRSFFPKENETNVLLMITDAKSNIKHYKIISVAGKAFIYGIEMINNQLFVSGNYSEALMVDNQSIKTEATREFFIAAFNPDLKPLWIKNTGIKHENPDESVFFELTTDFNGEKSDLSFISEHSYFDQQPILKTGKDKLLFTANFDGINPRLIDNEIYTRRNAFQYAQTVKGLYEYYLEQFYGKEIAGLFAFLTTMQGGNIKITGKELLATIRMIDEDFEKNYPRLFRDLNDIRKIESKNGIITIYTSLIGNFKAGPIVISNRAQIRIRNFNSGNMQVYVLSGISYRPFLRSYDINSIMLYRITGDLVVDFMRNRGHKSINMKKDLLK